jgi:hypothetical protein
MIASMTNEASTSMEISAALTGPWGWSSPSWHVHGAVTALWQSIGMTSLGKGTTYIRRPSHGSVRYRTVGIVVICKSVDTGHEGRS